LFGACGTATQGKKKMNPVASSKCVQGKQGFKPQMVHKAHFNSENKNSTYQQTKQKYKIKPPQPLQTISEPKLPATQTPAKEVE
jgi:hypothetical protein